MCRYHCRSCDLDFCVTCFGDMKSAGQLADKPPRASPQPSKRSNMSTNSPAVLRLREAKAMLDEGLISPDDYQDLKVNVLSALVNSPPR